MPETPRVPHKNNGSAFRKWSRGTVRRPLPWTFYSAVSWIPAKAKLRIAQAEKTDVITPYCRYRVMVSLSHSRMLAVAWWISSSCGPRHTGHSRWRGAGLFGSMEFIAASFDHQFMDEPCGTCERV